MNETLIKHVWLQTRETLPGRLEIDTFYHIADEGVFVIDHGLGPVEFGAQKAVNTLEGNETDKAPSVRAVNEGLRNIPGVAGLDRGVFATPEGLSAAHTTDVPGAYARVQSTDTVWSWNGTAWADTLMPISSLVTEVVDNLTSDSALKALSAKQGKALKGEIDGLVVDNLTTDDPDKALSAKQGKVLKDEIDAFEDLALSVDAQGYMCQTIEEE